MRNGPGTYRFRLQYGPSPRLSRVMPRALKMNAPGWTTVEIDPRGRLTFLLAAPASEWPAKAPDWDPLLMAAGLDPATLQSIPARETPTAPFDARAAWRGTYPGDRTPIRIEAAMWRGTPVFFTVKGAWDDSPEAAQRFTFGSSRLDAFVIVVGAILLVAALLLAWRNLRLRRGDRQGSTAGDRRDLSALHFRRAGMVHFVRRFPRPRCATSPTSSSLGIRRALRVPPCTWRSSRTCAAAGPSC